MGQPNPWTTLCERAVLSDDQHLLAGSRLRPRRTGRWTQWVCHSLTALDLLLNTFRVGKHSYEHYINLGRALNYLHLTFRSVSETVVRRSCSVLLPVLATVVMCRGKKSVVRVAQCIAALVPVHRTPSLRSVHCFLNPSATSIRLPIQYCRYWPVDYMVDMACSISESCQWKLIYSVLEAEQRRNCLKFLIFTMSSDFNRTLGIEFHDLNNWSTCVLFRRPEVPQVVIWYRWLQHLSTRLLPALGLVAFDVELAVNAECLLDGVLRC